jgi:hypothetical protein
MQNKTIAQVLKTCKKGDLLTNGKLYWKVVDTNFDYHVTVASPCKKNGDRIGSGFEIWSSGIESVAIIPDLKKVK